jgi:ATP-dependent Clp protease ATP-binding subunit ClpX
MLDVMYEVPSRDDVKTCHITKELVQKRSSAELLQLPTKDSKLKGEIA